MILEEIDQLIEESLASKISDTVNNTVKKLDISGKIKKLNIGDKIDNIKKFDIGGKIKQTFRYIKVGGKLIRLSSKFLPYVLAINRFKKAYPNATNEELATAFLNSKYKSQLQETIRNLDTSVFADLVDDAKTYMNSKHPNSNYSIPDSKIPDLDLSFLKDIRKYFSSKSKIPNSAIYGGSAVIGGVIGYKLADNKEKQAEMTATLDNYIENPNM